MATGKLVSDAARRLDDWLLAEKLKEGDRLPSERALARELGVKYYALNRAMGRLIAEGRVERQGYRLSLAARRQPAARLVLALVVSRRTHHLASYRRAAANLNIDLVVHTWEAAEEVAPILERLHVDAVDGVVCDPPTKDTATPSWMDAARQLIRHGIPVVCTGGWRTHAELPSVAANVSRGIALGFSHLTGLGHRELAIMTTPGLFDLGIGTDDYWKHLCEGSHLDESGGRVLSYASWFSDPHDVDALVGRLVDGPWKNVTGLVLLIGYNGAIPSFFTKLARRGRTVPGSLSVVVVGNAKTLRSAQPRVTAATFDMVLWFELTYELLRREIREMRQFGVQHDASAIHILPQLTVRESTRALPGAGSVPPAPDASIAAVTDRSALPKDGGGLERLVRQPYSIAARASLAERPRFLPVDLRPYVNRPLIFRRGWLGDIPLRCLDPGRHEIHGVPFEILGGPRRANCGAIVFQSTVNTTGNTRKLPDRLIIPVDSPCEAIYVLHGCGYAKTMQAFARYTFHDGRGEVATVPMVSLGTPGCNGDAMASSRQSALAANIQDWWSDFPHVDFPGARMAPLLEGDGLSHVGRHVFLYTLEWVNPSPKRPITYLEVQVDPMVPTTLGVLAITVVKPRGA